MTSCDKLLFAYQDRNLWCLVDWYPGDCYDLYFSNLIPFIYFVRFRQLNYLVIRINEN